MSAVAALLSRVPKSHPALLFTQGTVKHLYTRNQHITGVTAHLRQHWLRNDALCGGLFVDHVNHVTTNQKRTSSSLLNTHFSSHISDGNLLQVSPPLIQNVCHKHKQYGGFAKGMQGFPLSTKAIMGAAPKEWRPYFELVRFDKPIGSWLLFLPCAFSISLSAAPGCLPSLTTLGLFGLGSVLMRGAGCIMNDMWDKDFDAKVARTKSRPLASGQLTYFQALQCLGVHLTASLMILLSFNWYTIFLGFASIGLCVTYPLMKRYTYWPQAFLGLTFNWGTLMGWSAVTGSCQWGAVLPLYASCIAWTLVYDTIYAHQDKDDDILVGVKSTALLFGEDTKKWLTGFASVVTAGLAVTGYMCDQNIIYYGGVAMVATHLANQIKTVNLNNPDDCGAKFRSNRNLGIAFWVTIMVANLLN